MTVCEAATLGLYPLPDWAKDDLSELKGHQKADLIDGTESDAIVDVYDEVRAAVVERQESAGLDRIVEGQARWDDMLAHPLTQAAGVETRGIVRYYDNNNFYRDPVVVEDLQASGDVAAELDAAAAAVDADGSLQAVLPGPYSLADLGTDEYYGDAGEYLAAIADLLVAEIEQFPAIDSLVLAEPSLAVDPPDAIDRTLDAIEQVAGAAEETIVQSYWGVPDADTYPGLTEVADGVGLDFVTSADAALDRLAQFGAPDTLAVGAVDGQNTLVESPAGIATTVEDALSAASPETVIATANTELFYLPDNKFEAKLDALAAAPAEVEQ
ncbi:5-methyltetrahydropteroyltriglutamate--homocysteine methyltransferase [Halococcoides cellulosivorans]|uniref:5-methyltetrahydropteroyltriglutamate--homocysteine methyltransferase n=1 Tax=Halococcoides cellulosivorans TaxID=1679096 RepID=A0A2R4X2P7_9EURY|nr:5-methyltetrahydropteroyltriglutamate--homocysteine methyltransferase [Halococcoides cellulosivorans]AWB27983.1 5-methyltetrahydropteroyltriglutamate--homocysteine methyltransferase [Halococcoides cellulosivorans]